ncbi:MAG: RsmD family RNA methyltransferase [Bacteroidales bacterium]|nr:RsmD family RNA methyltransferase [Bacteroidales bacterium]
MRIVSGSLRGRRYCPPESFSARPTTDFAKENLFNVLANFVDFENSTILDLFAGSGGITYEFVSRGCQHLTCVEHDTRSLRFIAKTLADFGMAQFVKCIRGDALAFIRSTDVKYDIIFADPPYALPEVDSIPDLVLSNDILTDDGLFILEHSTAGRFNSHPCFWQTRSYGKVNFSFFRPKNADL